MGAGSFTGKGTMLISIVHIHFVDDCSRCPDSRNQAAMIGEIVVESKNDPGGVKGIPVP